MEINSRGELLVSAKCECVLTVGDMFTSIHPGKYSVLLKETKQHSHEPSTE
jgi:hypothetical protein